MPGYVLDHHLDGEGSRLDLMSRLLDPFHRRVIGELGIGPGDRTLEVGCGNGSVSVWLAGLAGLVGPTGQAVAVDLDLSLARRQPAPNLELRQADIVAGPVDPGTFDLVTARAVLHHVADSDAALRNLVAGLAPAARSCSSSRTSCPSASPSRPRCATSGRPGSRGRATTASTTSSGARWRRAWPPWVSRN